jgi:type III secretory pathway lipoprotein EscJ
MLLANRSGNHLFPQSTSRMTLRDLFEADHQQNLQVVDIFSYNTLISSETPESLICSISSRSRKLERELSYIDTFGRIP